MPIQGASVTYTYAGILKAAGVTDSSGSFRSSFIHRVDSYSYRPLDVFSTLKSFIAPLSIDASMQGARASTGYIPYVGDEITLPSWYGRIILRLPILAVRAVGFSHDMGTTALEILGYRGGYAGHYSYTPDEMGGHGGGGASHSVARQSANTPSNDNGFKYYDIRILKIAYSPGYVRVDLIQYISCPLPTPSNLAGGVHTVFHA